jgi:FixJ family two-component response regulator
MANQISMSQNQTIAALHAQGVSNRQIAALLNLHRDTVNRHVRLLKIQNRPETPPEKSRSLSCLIMSRACPSPAGKIHCGQSESRSRASNTGQRRSSG